MDGKQLKIKEAISTLDAYSDMQPDSIIHRSDCKLCNSEYREAVEREFSSSDSYKAAYNKIRMKDPSISYDAVRRHILNHFTPYMRGIMIKSYAKNIEKMMQSKYVVKQEITERIRILQDKIYDIGSMSSGANFVNTVKAADTLCKLTSAIARLDEQLIEINRELEPVYMVIQNLKDIINDVIKETNNPEITRAVKEIFTRLVESVKDNEIMIEKK